MCRRNSYVVVSRECLTTARCCVYTPKMMSDGESALRIMKRHNCGQMIQCVKFASRLLKAAIKDIRTWNAPLVTGNAQW
jgi:hypothetical protein